MLDYRRVFVFLFLCIASTVAVSKPMDITILAEYSAADDTNRHQILNGVIMRLAELLDRDSRLSLSLYGEQTHEIAPLEPVTEATGPRLMHALDGLPPVGAQRNPAASLEQTIYRLRTTGRERAERRIVMLGDGMVETGDATRNKELTQWMGQELSIEARRSNIHIDWLSLSETADYRIIQTVTQKTGGSYFRAYKPAEALSAIETIMTATQHTDTAGNAAVTDLRSPKAEALAPWVEPWSELNRRWVLVAGTLGLALLLLSSGLFLRRHRRSKAKRSVHGQNAQDSKALLRDLSHFTSMSEYDISDRRTYIGRQPREVTERSCIIMISDSSVGRNHAVIDCRDMQYWISDMDTVNGTYINGERVSGSRLLHHGDKIRFARFEFAVSLPHTADIADRRGQTYTVTDTIPDDERTVFRSRQ
jgi:hypothetical protein